ncbi:type II toxin-antitoxin system RelE/ParE family toxin [Rhizobium laguerreae]|uniref:type II toxin-antitoxin system RelE/ParE family toxin n=1 Tax=Rhizobium laguerreae TaxID=1076926 RepID=UPI0028C3830A|nr:type II toxin-antitoxin system RelE/ParE family toxin [Rhizobium laguerreae]
MSCHLYRGNDSTIGRAYGIRRNTSRTPQRPAPQSTKVDYPRESVNYSSQKYTVLQTVEFQKWLRKLKDRNARDRIVTRIVRAEAGNLGDHKFFDGIGELRLDYDPGYRLYFAMQGSVVVILLCGGAGH